MRSPLAPLRLVSALCAVFLCAPASAQDVGGDGLPPPPSEPAAEGATALASPGAVDGEASEQLLVPPPPPGGPEPTDLSAVEIAVEPLVTAAESALVERQHELAYARASLVISLLPAGAPLSIRAQGFRVLASRHASDHVPSIEAVLAPLLSQARVDLRADMPERAIARLDLALARLPAASPLRAESAGLRRIARERLRSSGAPYPPPPPPPERPPSVARAVTPAVPDDPTHRGTGEIVELYITASLFGALTGSYIPFVASNNMADGNTYGWTMLGGSGVMAASVLLLDLATRIPTGAAPTLSASIRFGFANGGLLAAGLSTLGVLTDPAVRFTLVWSGAVFGAVTGAALGFGITPSVQDLRFVESVAWWGGGLGAMLGLLTEDSSVGAFAGLGGLDLGLVVGAVAAASGFVFPRTRTLLLDLGWVVGATLGLGVTSAYFLTSAEPFSALALGIAGLVGQVAGWALVFGLTEGQDGGGDSEGADSVAASLRFGIAPQEGGAVVSLGGEL